jgi:hypothetical protein
MTSYVPTIPTRKSASDDLTASGVTGAALEALLDETAHSRHLARVAAATHAAEEYYLAACGIDRDDISEETLRLAAGAILWADAIGVGGRFGVEGASTERHPAFAGCGKGRKHATDGAAWSAAIAEAAPANCHFAVRRHDDGRVTPVFASPNGEISIDAEEVMPNRFLLSILREGLRRAYRIGGWHVGVPFAAQPDTLCDWADALNDATLPSPPMTIQY